METHATLRQIPRAFVVVSRPIFHLSFCYETWQKRATKRTNGWVFATPLILVCRDRRVVKSCDSLNRAFAQVNYPSRPRVHSCGFSCTKRRKEEWNARGGSDYPRPPLSRYRTRSSLCSKWFLKPNLKLDYGLLSHFIIVEFRSNPLVLITAVLWMTGSNLPQNWIVIQILDI